jgi:zinc transport system substrate-binding protein
MNFKILYLLPILLAAVISLSGCSIPADESDTGGLNVVTTIFAPYDFVRQLSSGTDTQVSMLLSPGTEVHSYDPTVQDIVSISECDLFIYTGGENDEWVEDILSSLDKPVRTFKMMDHVTKVEEEIKDGMQSLEDDTEWDEHVWTSPANVADISLALADELSELDAENASVYHNNLQSYLKELDSLDGEFREVVENAQHNTMIFADRFPVRYFTEEYGLDYFAAYPGCAADTEPSAGTLIFLINRVRDENIKAVFYIEMSDERIADTVCEATGTQKLLFHSCHNISKDEFENGETYISIMRKNLENLKIALN